MVLLLLLHDGADGAGCGIINAAKLIELALQMAKNHSLNRDRRGSNGASTKERSDETERISANTAKEVAAATSNASPLKLGLKNGAML